MTNVAKYKTPSAENWVNSCFSIRWFVTWVIYIKTSQKMNKNDINVNCKYKRWNSFFWHSLTYECNGSHTKLTWRPRTSFTLHMTHCDYTSTNVRNFHMYITSDISFLLHIVITLLDLAAYEAYIVCKILSEIRSMTCSAITSVILLCVIIVITFIHLNVFLDNIVG